MRLKDRVAIVVGAGQSPGEGMGNGRATALTFAREGAEVLCVDHALRRWGRIDILHNNVGVSLAGGDAELLDITEEALERCVAINLKSCIFAAKQVIPIMRKQQRRAII